MIKKKTCFVDSGTQRKKDDTTYPLTSAFGLTEIECREPDLSRSSSGKKKKKKRGEEKNRENQTVQFVGGSFVLEE